ncbi:MAG: hypothetical protein UHS32_01285 [Bacteroidaceae bacterium]|nr:hypothetical protein [Bacteroidaceae bacterium]
MPKILFRPAPTPPPFVPPVPSYDTEVHFIVEPYPYEYGESVDVTFEMFNLPNHHTWYISDNFGLPIINPREDSQLIPNQAIDCVTESVIDSSMTLYLYLVNDESQLIYECKAICDDF